jgi:transcriptional regulator GlxA family with amidase domain
MPAPIPVAFVAYEGVSLLDLSGPMEALAITSSHSDFADAEHPYECLVVTASGGPIRTSEGVRLVTEPIGALSNRPLDTLVVPGGPNVEDVTRDEALIAWLRQRAPECRRVCSVCAGAFALAKAGLLDGRRAATHWMHCDLLSAQYPNITVEPDAIFVRDGGVWTSAGVTTGIDLALALIEEDFGRPAAMHVARVLVVYLRRAGGQSQYSALLAGQTQSETDRFGDLERWVAAHLTADLSVERLA